MSTKITKYRTYKDSKTGTVVSVQPYLGDWLPRIIPVASDNEDYQEYLLWAKTNTAEEVSS